MTDGEAAHEFVRASWPHRFVVIEGVIGVGKTSLARRLAETIGAEAVLEQAGDNPFLERFYKDPRAAAFPAQLYFLFQRSRQLQALRQQDLFAPVRVADYLLDKDRLFARITLDDEEFALYQQVYERMAFEAPRPDLVVFLQAPGGGAGRSASCVAASATNRSYAASTWSGCRPPTRASSTSTAHRRC